MHPCQTRRTWLRNAAAAVSGAWIAGPQGRAAAAPASPVALARCRTYESAELLATLQKLFDQLGGLGRLVKGKTVAIKVNLTGAPTYRVRVGKFPSRREADATAAQLAREEQFKHWVTR